MANLEDVIKDSIDDATTDAALDTAEVDTPEVDTPADEAPAEAPAEESPEPAEEPAPEGDEVASPAAQQAADAGAPKPAVDEFAKKHGLPQPQEGKRDNRIPYSNVKKIVTNAERKVAEPLQAKITEYEGKVKDYETRLSEVGKFEDLMVKDHMGFLSLLAERIPGYAEVLNYIATQGAQGQAPQEPQKPVDDDMPKPDYQMPDGSMVYSMDGLKARDAWNRAQAKKEALSEVDAKYGFVAEEKAARDYYERLIPGVNSQIADFKTWPGYTKELEDQVADVLAKNPRWDLARAYNSVYLPKLQAEVASAKEYQLKAKAEARKEVLAEMQKAPSTSVRSGGAVKPRPSTQGPRSLEDVIRESIDASGLSR